jgi:hypothetical protein
MYSINTLGHFTKRYRANRIGHMPEFSPEQHLLMRLRDERCDHKTINLAKAIGKDASYVGRLLYPIGKKARKNIGLEIMQACSKAFNLPPGFWEGAPSLPPSYQITPDSHPTNHILAKSPGVVQLSKPNDDKWISEAIDILRRLNEAQRAACVVNLRAYEGAVAKPEDGHPLSMAG